MYKFLPQLKRGGNCYALYKYLLVMKLIVILLLLTIFQVNAKTYAQRITLNRSHAPLEQLIKEVGSQTGYDFFYNLKLIRKSTPVTINVNNATIEETLRKLFTNQPITYTISAEEKAVIIKARETEPEQPGTTAFFGLKGRVTDENGEGLPGASIKMMTSGETVITDAEGNFELKNLNGEGSIQVSYVGYATKEVKITPKLKFLDIMLMRFENKLDEVVLVGYGTSTKRLNTGTVSSVTSADITGQPIANPLAAMIGRVAGMSITQNSGLPGSNFEVQIRGQNSLQSGSKPLYVIDGVPFSGDNLNAFGIVGANGGISAFSTINPSDIERIDVLKDADATSIYGARGANGVVLVTTKRGKAGKASLNANVYRGVGKVSHFIPMLNTPQYLELRREAFQNQGITPDNFNAPDLTLYDQNAYTDWQRELLSGSANITDVQTNFSGGDSRIRFLVNANYRKEGTVFKGNMGTERMGGRMNLDYNTPEGQFSANFSAAFSSDKTNLVATDVTNFYNLPPNFPLYNSEGTLYWDSYQDNPLGYLNQKYHGLTNTLLANATLKYTPVYHLQLKMNIGYNQTTLEQNSAYPSSSFNPALGQPSTALFGNNRSKNYVVEPTADYTLEGDNWKLNFLAGTSWNSSTNSGNSVQGLNYSSDALLGSIVGAGILQPMFQNIDKYNFNSVFGRVNYNLKEKYLLNMTFRRDGSSKFGENNKFGNFASLGAAWIFTEEEFVKKNLGFLSFGKLRGSYGTTGNDQIRNYQYLTLYEAGPVYDQQPTIHISSIPNPDIRWETTRKLEFAVDFGILKDRVLLSMNYYRNRSSNQIIFTPIGTQSGFTTYSQNVDGVIQNKGFEFDFTSRNISGKNLKWTTTVNLSLPSNKLISFPGLQDGFLKDQYVIGQPINSPRYFQYTGVNSTTGDITYQDLDQDGQPDFLMQAIGTPFYGGISNTLSYKNWTLDFLIQFNHKKGINNLLSSYRNEAVLGNMSNQNTSVLDRWRNPGDQNTLFPAAVATPDSEIYGNYSYYNSSNAHFGDNSFLRFKSVNLGYNFQGNWLKAMHMAGMNVYVQGQNLLTLTRNKYVFDPETAGIGIGTMPLLRTFVVGLNCSF